MRIIVAFFLVLVVSNQSQASQSGDRQSAAGPLGPIHAPLPLLPNECSGQITLSNDSLRFVTLFGIIDWEGRATQVQVQDPSDDCLKDSAVEAIREWVFEPVEPGTKEYWRQAFEATLIYPAEGSPRFEMSANDRLKRYPPRFPDRCQAKARPMEAVSITYDVTMKGTTENIKSVFSSNSCFEKSAINAVKRWRYNERIVGGKAYPRIGNYTELTFELATSSGSSIRREVAKRLFYIARTLDRKLDPRVALEKIDLFERRFSGELRDGEKAALLRYRGSAKIDASEYQGAIEDLTVALALENDASTAVSIQGVIDELEAAIEALGSAADSDPN